MQYFVHSNKGHPVRRTTDRRIACPLIPSLLPRIADTTQDTSTLKSSQQDCRHHNNHHGQHHHDEAKFGKAKE